MSSPAPRAWIVVPCFNEAARLPVDRFREFSAAHPGLGFCFVNDGSADATADVLRGLAAADPDRLRMLNLPVNAGKAQAVRAGVLDLLENVAPELVGYWDADLATPLEEIPRFLAHADAHPAVRFILGARVRRLGARVERKLLRHYLGRIFATAASAILDLPVYDTQCGAKLLRADLARSIFDQPFLSRWFFDVELLARASRLLGRPAILDALLEIPLDQWQEMGESRVRAIHFLRAPLELLRIRRAYRSGNDPRR
jgi:glycosyltransferase involved in cell wall biosynthesis